MISGRNIKAMIKDVGPDKYAEHLRELLGIRERPDSRGRERLVLVESEAQIGVDEFSIRDIVSEFFGHDMVGGVMNAKGGAQRLREAMDPVMSTNFSNINAVNQTIGGLIERQTLAGYQLPEYIADKVFETQTTKTNGGKMSGIPGIQLTDGFTPEGQDFAAVGLTERWVIAGENKKKTRQLSLTAEGVAYDLTGELMSEGESAGKSLGYEKEYWCAAVAQGVDIAAGTPGFMAGLTCNTYIYKGQSTDTPNATYQTAAAGTGTSAKYNYINKFANTLTDYKNFQAVQAKLNLMREPETGFPITAKLADVLVSPNAEYNARMVINSTQVLQAAGASGLSGAAGTGTFAENPVPRVNLFSSPIWNKVLTDSGVSQTNADIRWLAGELKKAFVWRELFPMRVEQAALNSAEMLSKQIVAAWFAAWSGCPVVRDPHYVIDSTE